jgi:putative MATE family efflux protein
MKKNLIGSYVSGIVDIKHGERFSTILNYFYPEFITALVLYSVLYLIDARWIATLKSTSIYATVGTTNTLLHSIIKIAEGFQIGTVILAGHFNGLEEYKQVGRTLTDSFWITVITGTAVALALYCGAYWIYAWYGVPPKMILLGVPFLRIKAISIFFMFIYFAIVGFLRGIKKPQIPMRIFIVGALAYLFFDYGLIFGAFGLPQLGLNGAALATVIQYGLMLFIAIAYLLLDKENRKYGINLFVDISDWTRIKELIRLSWPVMLDKALLSTAYIWLGYMINPMGKYAIASYTVIKDLERLAIQPAAAFAQVITFLVSNDYGLHNWEGIKSNIKKTIFLASIFVFAILLTFSIWPEFFIQIFDLKGKFTTFSARIFSFMSILVFFDLLQLILAGALRGAANVKVVMMTRLVICCFYFIPVSWLLSQLPIQNLMVKFLLIYSSFYIGNGLMSIIYIWRFRGERWKQKTIE